MTTTAREQQNVFAPASEAGAAPSWKTHCLNCNSALDGPFCGQCGQRTAPPHPSLRELGGEAFAEFSGWDGKLASTLKLLVMRPGELTRQFLDGRRARFISPLRLYLSASLVFFLLAGRTPIKTKPVAPNVPVTVNEEARAKVLAVLAASPAPMRPLILQTVTNQTALVAGVMEALPKGLFALLPVFAAILMPFYRGRKFTEHLYFAIHVHAFIFVAFDTTMILQRVIRAESFSLVAAVVAALWIPLYTHFALVRVYGGSQMKTLAKELGISALYGLASIPMIVLVAMWVAWRMS
jgi:hypothetical protein